MATFVNDFFSRMLPRSAAGSRGISQERVERRPEPGTLRPMPNEQIHLFVKRIDNHHVVRTEDKAATATTNLKAVTGMTSSRAALPDHCSMTSCAAA